MEPLRRTRTTSLAVVSAGSLLVAVLAWQRLRRWLSRRGSEEGAPQALPRLPLLGNALSYQADPAAFLGEQRRLLGSCFRLDLAGLRMTVVSARHELAVVAGASEAVLSAREATADFGFAETLGHFNVHFGTELHRFVLKRRAFTSTLASEARGSVKGSLEAAVRQAVSAALPGEGGHVADAVTAFRRIMLHSVCLHLLGESVLRAYRRGGGKDFLADFMAYQDRVEDATAKGVALPSTISRLLIWRPVRNERVRMVRALSRAIALVKVAGEDVGVWLETVQTIDSRSDIPAWRRYVQGRNGQSQHAASDSQITPEEAAELIVGLLFAAHKNPGIGAAQTLLFLLERPSVLRKVLLELRGGQDSGSSGLLKCSLLEALRLTAHTIGGIRKVIEPGGFHFDAADGRRFRVRCGEYIVLAHLLPNTDPANFPNPSTFDPDRFAGPEVDELTFTTFSQGLHRCPGRTYALRLMEQVLGEALRHYTFRLGGELPPLCHRRATLAQRSGPCPLEYERTGAD